MYTYQELEKLNGDETKRREFIRGAVGWHTGTEAYRVAANAEQYYAKKNPTILKFQKTLRDACGETIPDIWSADYKLTHGFFRQFVIQQVQFVLSNGVTFKKKATKQALGGALFDNKLQRLAKKAVVDGVSFGFWNLDHLEVFSFVDTDTEPGFVPIYDEDTGLLRAGVRYWKPNEKTYRWTLYEPDGYTEYIQREKGDMELLGNKQPYIKRVRKDGLGDSEVIGGGNYPGFPIIPMYANDLRESEIVGVQSSIDCYDFISSGLANAVDDTSAFYWTLQSTGGMDDKDLSEFVARMKQIKAVVLNRGVEAEAHTLAVPVEAHQVLLDYLKNDMYDNMMLLNVDKALSGDKTATSIRLAYQPQDDKCGDFEFCIRDFIGKLLELTGIDDEPSFKWNRIANQTEETQMVMTAAQYLDDEAVLKHLPWLTPEEVEELLKRRDAEALERISSNVDGNMDKNEVASPNEAIDIAEDTVGKTLNGAQTQSLISVIGQLQSGVITEGQAVNIIATAIGISKDEAKAIIRGG